MITNGILPQTTGAVSFRRMLGSADITPCLRCYEPSRAAPHGAVLPLQLRRLRTERRSRAVRALGGTTVGTPERPALQRSPRLTRRHPRQSRDLQATHQRILSQMRCTVLEPEPT